MTIEERLSALEKWMAETKAREAAIAQYVAEKLGKGEAKPAQDTGDKI